MSQATNTLNRYDSFAMEQKQSQSYDNFSSPPKGFMRRPTIHAEDMGKQLNGLSAVTIASGWAENSSCTGVPNIVRSDNKLRVSVWAFLVIVGLGATAYHMSTMFAKYYKYDITVSIDLSYATHMTFPAVTICNVNAVRASKLAMGGADMMAIFPLSQGTSNSTSDSSGRATTILQFANQYAVLPEATKTEMGHQLTDMLIDCLESGSTCLAANFTQFTNTQYGNCYTLNEEATLKTHRPGISNGISMELFIEQTEYIPDITESAGVVLVLHDENTAPFPDETGYLLQPGTVTNIALRQLEILRQPDPYPHMCWDVGAEELASLTLYSESMDFGYSIEACYKTCYQVELMNTCGCGDAYYPLYGTALRGNSYSLALDPCTNSTQLTCEDEVKTLYKNGLLACNCSLPCSEIRFEAVASSASWPNVMYEAHYKNKLRTVSSSLQSIVNDNTMTVSQHILKVNIFYTELNKEKISESAAYGTASLFADVGGVIGLYLGISVVAVFEIAELIIDLAFYGIKACGKKSSVSSTT